MYCTALSCVAGLLGERIAQTTKKAGVKDGVNMALNFYECLMLRQTRIVHNNLTNLTNLYQHGFVALYTMEALDRGYD
jgi:hypothetical protein